MVTLTELSQHLNLKLDISLFKDACPNGIQIEGKKEIRKAVTAVTSSMEAIRKAVEEGADALIVHHGLFWNKDEYPLTGTKKTKIKLLLDHEISLLAYHLPLDAHRQLGNNWVAAKEMQWTALEPFGLFDGQYIGVKGVFPVISVEAFRKILERYYGQAAHAACGGKKEVKSAALISGGAYRAVTEAAKQELDCFISGNFDEPAWHHAFEEKINFFAMGHNATEKVGPRVMAGYIHEAFGIPCSFLDLENPF